MVLPHNEELFHIKQRHIKLVKLREIYGLERYNVGMESEIYHIFSNELVTKLIVMLIMNLLPEICQLYISYKTLRPLCKQHSLIFKKDKQTK